MNKQYKLILFTRAGCCLCEGLEESLCQLTLAKLDPPLELVIRDIDQVNLSDSLKTRYSLAVPVLLLEIDTPYQRIELPRVSPRLQDDALSLWLEKVIKQKLLLN